MRTFRPVAVDVQETENFNFTFVWFFDRNVVLNYFKK